MIAIIQLVVFCLIISFTLAVITKPEPHVKKAAGRYILTIRNATKKSVNKFMESHGKRFHGVRHVFRNGFAVKLNETDLKFFNSSEEVLHISPDSVMSIAGVTVTQTNATWGLNRVSQRKTVNSMGPYSYKYDSVAGQGVNIYVIDTGVNTDHNEFVSRASLGPCFVNGGNCTSSADDNGHGTHCAGTAAGTTYGVAKNANIIAIKVLDAGGSGYTSDVIAGVNYVASITTTTSKNVISMSLVGEINTALNDAIENAINSGVTVVCAAGNGVPYNETVGTPLDACNYSPSSAANAITVAATDISDKRAQWSNCGKCIDMFAPGVRILSAWIGSITATNTISGTSMATPHVAGMAAYMLSIYGQLSPAQCLAKIQQFATNNAVSIGSCPTNFGATPNKFLQNDKSM